MIYFIQAGEDGPVKIGYSKSVKGAQVRQQMMQTGHHEDLILRSVVPGSREDEGLLHEVFASSRLRGEWFRPCDGLRSLIASPSLTQWWVDRTWSLRRWRDAGFTDAAGVLTSDGVGYLIELERYVAESGVDLLSYAEHVQLLRRAA